MNRARLATVALALLASSGFARAVLPPLRALPADTVEELTKKLKDPNDEVRRVAVADLAQLKTVPAWAVVVDALADPSPRVADEAQVRLADIEDPAALKALYGKSGTGAKDPIVQARAAEALGRMKIEVDGIALSKLLSNRDLEVRRTAARALERLALDNKLEKKSRSFAQQQLEQAVKGDKDPLIRAAALPARHAIAKYTESDLFAMLSKRDSGIVRGAVSCSLAEVGWGSVIGLTNDTLEEEEPCTVRVLAEILRIRGIASSARSLTRLMDRYPNLRLSWTIVDVLRDWSGLPHGRDDEAWQNWADGLGDDWTAPDQPKTPAERRYSGKAVFLGQTVISDRVAILVDVSDWILKKRADGTVNKAWVKGEIEKVLGLLPERSAFNVVACSGTPAPCEKALVPVKPDSIKHAAKWFEAGAWSGKANVLDAVWLALADKDVDTIVVVTSGPPAGSEHVDVDLISEQFAQRNRFLRVVLDVVIVGDADVADAWRRVVASSGGRVDKAAP